MRITHCHIDAFGHLADRTLDDLDHPVVVLLGPNEAGKSTCFAFFRTMLYGIYPVVAENHPYAPRDGRRLEGRLAFRCTNGTGGDVVRRLTSTPWGRLTSGGREEDLRNGTLPVVQHIPKRIFEAVYALTLRDLVEIDGKAWEEIQDRLLGGLSIDYVRSAGQVVSKLEDEANKLWRSDRYGKPASKQLEQQLRELRGVLAEARENDETIRALHDEIDRHSARIDELEDEQLRLRAECRRADRLVPVRKLLRAMESRLEEAGDLSSYAHVPDDPRAHLDWLATQLEDLASEIGAIAEKREEAERAIEAFTPADARLIEYRTSIRTWAKKAEAHEHTLSELEVARRRMDASQARLEQLAGRLLTRKWDAGLVSRIRDLAEAELRQRVKAYEEAAARLSEAEAQQRALELSDDCPRPMLPWILAAVLGAALLVLGFVLDVSVVQLLGVACLAVGAVQLFSVHQHNRRREARTARLDLEDLRRDVEQRAAAVAAILEGVPLPEGRLRRPDQELITDLKDLRAELEDYLVLREQVEELNRQRKDDLQAVTELAEACGHAFTGHLSETVTTLEQALADAEDRERRAEAAREELNHLAAEADKLEAGRQAYLAEQEQIVASLTELGEGDVEAGIEALHRRRQAAEEAEHHRKILEREHPDWQDLRDEIERLEQEGGTWAYTDEAIVRMQQRLEEIDAAIREETDARAAKRANAENLMQHRSADDVAGEIEYVKEQLRTVHRERDRLLLLARIITRADHRFRERHQPDVIRRAGRYLHLITGGRYERLILEEGDRRLKVYEQGARFPMPVSEPLSRGTLDQIYLALRLAIIDHLDENQERLPVFFDEVFVNWDEDRRRNGYRILEEMAGRRQLFLFTCHPWFAGELTDALDAKCIPLDLPDGSVR